jgi:hypothetical protein
MTRKEFDAVWEKTILQLNGVVNEDFLDETWDLMNEVEDLANIPAEVIEESIAKIALSQGSRHGRYN